MPKFRKKPVVIDAVLFDGRNHSEVLEFMGHSPSHGSHPSLTIATLEGNMTALPGDWIIKGVMGEFYPCKAHIFAETYEAAE
jgi:hypothetical protein